MITIFSSFIGKKQASKNAFIVKPDQGRQGEGIYIVVDPRDVLAAVGMRPAIVQVYRILNENVAYILTVVVQYSGRSI